MGFYRIYSTKDTFITNVSPDNLETTRATGSNHGRSPSLEVFSRKGDINSSSIELARSLLQFDITELSGKIYNEGIIPSSSVSYFLKMFNKEHAETVPTSYDLFAYPISRSFDEGSGIDNENFRDIGYANWLSASSTQTWTVTGSDFLASGYGSASQHFDQGQEDLELNITSVVNNWLTSSVGLTDGLPNNGLVIKLGDAEESNSVDYFTKKFHSRESKFVDRIPYIEARWNNVLKDNRNNFAYNQDNNLYLYNFIRGELVNLSEPVIVRIRDSLVGASSSYSAELTASRAQTGIYSASFNISNTASFSSSWYDVWFSGLNTYLTGTFTPLSLTGSDVDQYNEFVLNVTNLKRVYDVSEEARLKVNVRKKDYKTHVGVFATASLEIEKEYIEKLYYSVTNNETGEIVVPFGTGTIPYTQLSYDKNGNYFNIWMRNFIPGFMYRIKFLIDINQSDRKVIDENYLFKVV